MPLLYSDNTPYCGYTSRIARMCKGGCAGCTTIFTCSNHNSYCYYGWWLKQQFNKIYGKVGCGRCGSYTFSAESTGCRVTLNYCALYSCNDSG
ncbi:hypothetical protein B0T16DRAFT_457275 [Cercophora newfieldiana]|uniref:Uncharacterized protein n=1 Tax=Cercophora newfieldiana TaxID=92897 RepID=A0AA40CTA7_9PEZI|nr:hypothetical protein B0T16DRAFT_457275 [Cercophora newfieldiana]